MVKSGTAALERVREALMVVESMETDLLEAETTGAGLKMGRLEMVPMEEAVDDYEPMMARMEA